MDSAARRTVQMVAGRILLAMLLVWALGSLYVSVSFLWTPQGAFGLASDYGGNITDVVPDSPAAHAGIRPGDRILLGQTPFEARPKLVGVTTPVPAGARVRFRVQHAGTARDVTLVAVAAHRSVAERVALILGSFSAALFIIVGAALIWLHPSPVAWGFGLYGLLTNPVIPALSHFPSAQAHLAYVMFYDVAQNIGVVGLLVFALNFPRPLPVRWRSLLARLLPLLFVLLAAWTTWIDLAVCVFAVPVHECNVALQVAFGIVDLLAILLITETYLKGPAENRPRLRWVLVGFYAGLVFNYIGNVLVYTANLTLPLWLDGALIATEVTLPLAVAYAIVRHRVIEIDVFVSRALVYGAFTTLLVVLFGATDWLFGLMLADFRLSIIFDAGITIGIALVFDRVQKVLEETIGQLVFRARQAAYRRLDRASRTFRFVTDSATLDHMVVGEPHDAFDIAALALFRRDGGVYRRVAAIGWNELQCSTLGADDRLILEHEATEGSLHLADVPWRSGEIPTGVAAPRLSIPLRCASILSGILLCSLERDGEDLDQQELQKLVEFTNSAAVAYDRIDAERLRTKAAQLELEVQLLQARLDEVRGASIPGTSVNVK
jgi:hypothetical protein